MVAGPVPREGAGLAPPAGRSRWTVPGSNPRAAGESILGGGGAADPGPRRGGSAGRETLHSELGRGAAEVQAPAFCCSLPWRPVERPEPVPGPVVSVTPGRVLQPQLGPTPRGLQGLL